MAENMYLTPSVAPWIPFYSGIGILFTFLIAQYSLLLALPEQASMVGDEYDYVSKATFLVQHGRLPKYSELQPGAIQVFGAWKYSRPPGLPLLLASLCVTSETVENGRLRFGTLNFIGVSLALFGIYVLFCRHSSTFFPVLCTAIVLGIQPWCFEYLTSYVPDSLVLSVSWLGICLVSLAVPHQSTRGAVLFISSAAFLFGIASFLRPEMVAFGPIILACGLMLRRFRRLPVFGSVVTTSVIMIAVVLLHTAYHWYYDRDVRVVDTPRAPYPGLYKWAHTFLSSEQVKHRICWRLPNGTVTMAQIPQSAFQDEIERETVQIIVDKLSAGTKYSQEMDADFNRLAEQRRSTNYLSSVTLVKAWSMMHLWVNLETNRQLLMALKPISRPVRRVILGLLLLMKCCLVCLAIIGTALALRRVFDDSNDVVTTIAILAGIFMISRTVVFGGILTSCEHRYVLCLWPCCLYLACYSIDQFLKHDARMSDS